MRFLQDAAAQRNSWYLYQVQLVVNGAALHQLSLVEIKDVFYFGKPLTEKKCFSLIVLF